MTDGGFGQNEATDLRVGAEPRGTPTKDDAPTPGQASSGAEAIEASATGQADADDVGRTLNGDRIAFNRLVERHQRRAISVAYRLLGNVDDAMDVCQEGFLRAYRSLATLKEPKWFGTWLLRIVSNLSLNFRRSRRPTLSLAPAEDAPGISENAAFGRSHSPEQTDPGEAMQSAEAQAAVTAAIQTLPPKQRMALILFAIEGLPQKEVAAIMDCSVELVKWNVFQARKLLKDKLADWLEL